MRSLQFSLALGVSMVFSTPLVANGHDHQHTPQRVEYVRNSGQWPTPVLYKASVPGAVAFLEQNGVTWVKYEESIYAWMHDSHQLSPAEQATKTWNGHAWRMSFVGGQATPVVFPGKMAKAYHNYFLGNDPTKWAGRVPLYGEVRYEGVWPGVDILFHGDEGLMKYDIELAASADPAVLALAFEGLDGLSIDAAGNLVLRTSVGEVKELAPVAFYGDGAREPLACRFTLVNGRVGFEFPNGKQSGRALVIDPVLIASTLSGATGASNYGHCATYDDAGNIYTGARNFGPSYPATVGAFQTTMGGGGTDISISKYNPDGSDLIYATYLGGNSGENPHSMVVSTEGELCVLGSTTSTNFPVSAGAFDNSLADSDITLTRFSADGSSLIGSTFVGGSGSDGLNNMWGNYGETYRGEIYLDPAGNMLVASFSSSTDFPTTAGAFQSTLGGMQDGVVFSMPPACNTLLWSTYLGGSQDDNALGLRIGVTGDIVVTGQTDSGNFPTTAGAYQTTLQGDRDGYVVRLAPGATGMLRGTFFGTADADRPYFVDLDLDDEVWIYGQTDGTITIQPAGTYGQAGGPIFIAELSQDLSAAPIQTTINATGGWGGGTAPVAFLVDVCDNIYISGYNSSSGLPTTANALYTTGSFYLAAFEPDMANILFGTYYGGSHVDGGTSRFDKNGIVYQGVCSGGGFPTTTWAHATTQSIGWDIGVFKIDFGVAGVNAAGASAINTGCAPIEVDFSNASSGDTWLWDFGDGSPEVEAFEPSHTYTEPGDYLVRLIAMDSLACNLADTVYFPITIGAQQPVAAVLTWSQEVDCTQMIITAENQSTGDPLDHIWDMGDGTTYEADEITHVYSTPGTYDVMLVAFDPTGCSQSDTVIVPITVEPITFEFDIPDQVKCEGVPITLDASSVPGAHIWSTGETSPSIVVNDLGEYWVTVSGVAGCMGTDTLLVVPAPEYELAFEAMTCPGVKVPLSIPLEDAQSYLWSNGATTRMIEVDGVDTLHVFQVVDAFGCLHQDTARVNLYDADVQLFAPNAFSPNEDGLNDVFQVLGYGYANTNLTIYDRWGERLYEADALDRPWDGRYKGTLVKNDVYVYVLRYTGTCTGTKEHSRTGHVMVVR